MKFLIFIVAILFLGGCWTTKNAQHVDAEKLSLESSVVFARGEYYTIWFGGASPWKMFEVIYERFYENDAGQGVVEIGIRYKGGTSWTNWWDKIPNTVTMAVQCNFYNDARRLGPIVYSSNRQPTVFKRGETIHFMMTSPVKSVKAYQLVIGE